MSPEVKGQFKPDIYYRFDPPSHLKFSMASVSPLLQPNHKLLAYMNTLYPTNMLVIDVYKFTYQTTKLLGELRLIACD